MFNFGLKNIQKLISSNIPQTLTNEDIIMVFVDFVYPEYVPCWNAELQKNLVYEDVPAQGASTVAEKSSETTEVIIIEETTPTITNVEKKEMATDLEEDF